MAANGSVESIVNSYMDNHVDENVNSVSDTSDKNTSNSISDLYVDIRRGSIKESIHGSITGTEFDAVSNTNAESILEGKNEKVIVKAADEKRSSIDIGRRYSISTSQSMEIAREEQRIVEEERKRSLFWATIRVWLVVILIPLLAVVLVAAMSYYATKHQAPDPPRPSPKPHTSTTDPSSTNGTPSPKPNPIIPNHTTPDPNTAIGNGKQKPAPHRHENDSSISKSDSISSESELRSRKHSIKKTNKGKTSIDHNRVSQKHTSKEKPQNTTAKKKGPEKLDTGKPAAKSNSNPKDPFSSLENMRERRNGGTD